MYVADQGTLTKWLVDNTAGASPDQSLVILAATNTKYAEAAAKIADGQVDAATSLVKELAKDILAAEPLEVFLTVTTPEGGKSMVVTVARLARYPRGPAKCSVSLGKLRRGSRPIQCRSGRQLSRTLSRSQPGRNGPPTMAGHRIEFRLPGRNC
jgi:hypothetical protein